MMLREVLDKTVEFFKNKKIETPRLDTEILLTEALGFKNRVDLYLKYDQPLKDEELVRSREFVKRRAQGEPVAYIIGKKDFFGFTFIVTPDVLIPRPETELLVEDAIHWLQRQKIENPVLLDLGCGSGCIGLSFLKKVPASRLVAVDISPEALEVARQNAERLGVANRTEFICSPTASLEFDRRFDIILGNPPYIAENDPHVQLEVKMFEPPGALFSEDDGLADLKQWSSQSNKWTNAVSYMGFEMGSTQSSSMKNHFSQLGPFAEIRIIKDLAGLDRHIVGVKNG